MRAVLTPRYPRFLTRVGITFLALAFLASACSANGGNGPPGSSDSITVVAAFYPIQAAAEAVGENLVEVTNLTGPGVEPHDMELTPDAVEQIQSTDLVLYVGEGFQPAVEDAVPDAGGVVVDLLADLPTVAAPPSEAAEGLTADPHVWLDPMLYAAMVDEIEAALAGLAPGDAGKFRTNARAFNAGLTTLDDDFSAGLATCSQHLIVTNHAAFGYLAAAYGLSQEAISGLAPDAEPSVQRIAELKDLVEHEGITTIFTEELVEHDVAETLANEASVQTRVLYTIEGLTSDEAAVGDDYDSLMRKNLATLEEALGCS
jgi:zinc transport system substrate-binding protein